MRKEDTVSKIQIEMCTQIRPDKVRNRIYSAVMSMSVSNIKMLNVEREVNQM